MSSSRFSCKKFRCTEHLLLDNCKAVALSSSQRTTFKVYMSMSTLVLQGDLCQKHINFHIC